MRYEVFISYRHVPADRRWAKWLHSALETYRIPRSMQRARSLPARIGRVFRDEEELAASANLSDSIQEALRDSRFLVVVCSPEAKESRWVDAEVERFRSLGRGDQILALLVSGEPRDAFPRALCEIRPSAASRSQRLGHLGRIGRKSPASGTSRRCLRAQVPTQSRDPGGRRGSIRPVRCRGR